MFRPTMRALQRYQCQSLHIPTTQDDYVRRLMVIMCLDLGNRRMQLTKNTDSLDTQQCNLCQRLEYSPFSAHI
jgi:hypothetical protein